MTKFRDQGRKKKGVALVLVLTMLVLLTILIVGLSGLASTERSVSRHNLDHQDARAVADLGRDHAVALLRDSIEGARAAGEIWSSQPGKITAFTNNAGTVVDPNFSRELSSGSDTTQPLVDLNRAAFGGVNPIASRMSVNAGTAPAMNVNWISVLKDPTSAAGVTNPMVGRYAFWVDDESSKVNVNTADGTSKYSDPDLAAAPSSSPVSFGNGVPTEVSLSALVNISGTTAQAIANVTGVRPGAVSTRFFDGAAEILGVKDTSGTQPDYTDNNFNTTVYSRSPELNIFGEPKIYLTEVLGAVQGPNAQTVNLGTGPYAAFGGGLVGKPLLQVYPSSNPIVYQGSPVYSGVINKTGVGNQLPPFKVNSTIAGSTNMSPAEPLPQYPYNMWPIYGAYYPFQTGTFNTSTLNYDLGMRIAQYLKGYNSQGNAITWPSFPGSSAGGFAAKYTDRQIDSITLQILDLTSKNVLIDSGSSTWTDSSIMLKGFLSGQPVRGISRSPHICGILLTFAITPSNPPQMHMNCKTLWYLPKEYKGYDLNGTNWRYGYYPGNTQFYINVQDCPYAAGNHVVPGAAADLGGYWANHLLKFKGQDGKDAGIDLMGNESGLPDPDQASASIYHYANLDASTGKYAGNGPSGGQVYSLFEIGMMSYNNWVPGDYHTTENVYDDPVFYKMRQVNPAIATTDPNYLEPLSSVTVSGGLSIWMHDANFNFTPIESVPLDGIIGPKMTGDTLYTQGNPDDPSTITYNDKGNQVVAAVIPMPDDATLSVPSEDDVTGSVLYVLMEAPDPMVNNFPGDWVTAKITDPTDPRLQIYHRADNAYGMAYQAGACQRFQAAGGGDPSAYWLPEQNPNIPKSQRFPSVGYLQYIRTGLMPDKQYDVDPTDPATETAAKGTPFRLLSLAPSYDPTNPAHTTPNPGQTTAGGSSYPDWAMLDLFTVPVSPQPLGTPPQDVIPNLEMTSGGSTPGRININSAAQLTSFSPAISRTSPLNAVFKGLQVSNSYGTATPMVPEAPVMSTVDEAALTGAITVYLASLKDSNNVSRPLLMPSEIANVPEVANYVYNGSANPTPPTTPFSLAAQSRNDLIRQALGNLTTQSNTYSVWVVGQTMKKLPGNSNYGTFENGDLVLSESRTHYVVERYLDLGTDGVVGNAKSNQSGVDGVVGTPDDLVDGDDSALPPTAGANPKMIYPLPYKYRVILAEEISN